MEAIRQIPIGDNGKAGSPEQPRAANGRAEGADTPRGPEAPSNERPRAAPVPPSLKCNILKRKAKPGLCLETGCGSRVWYFYPTLVWCRLYCLSASTNFQSRVGFLTATSIFCVIRPMGRTAPYELCASCGCGCGGGRAGLARAGTRAVRRV